MKCNFCGQEYEFSLGHRCLVMQEESKQPMPQPDLVSKLREVIAECRKRAELADAARKNGAVSQLTEYAMRTIMADDIERLLAVEPHELESLLGGEGQAAQEALCGTAGSATISTNEAGRRTAMDVSPSEELLSRPHRIVSHEQMESVLNAPEPNVTVNPDGSCSPSTPIVPGTAGLSAEQVQASDGLNAVLGAATPAERWTCPDCGYDSMPYPPKDYHICPKCMVEFGNDDRKTTLIEREARIRKDAQEEAAQHKPQTYIKNSPITAGQDGVFTIGFLGCSCGWNSDGEDSKNGTWETHIRALAERPAPAGEVKQAPGSVRRAENEAVRLIALLVNELSGKPAPENRIRLVIQDALDVAQGNEPPSRRRGDVHGTA